MTRSRDNLTERRFIVVALALIVFPILVAVAYYATRKLLPVITNFQFAPRAGTESFRTASTTSFPLLFNATRRPFFLNFSLPHIPMLTFSNLLIIIAVLVVLYICIQTFRVISGRLRIRPIGDIDILEEDRQKVAEILEETARKLGLGSNYRDTVLKCYSSIVKVLEARSLMQSKTLTPAEFRETVSQKLKLDSPSFSKVTSLFEVARYSENEITQRDAKDAIESLSTLSSELRSKDLASTR